MKHLTTTDMDPDEVHNLGLREVARIEAEQAAIAKRLGYPDLEALRAALKTDRGSSPPRKSNSWVAMSGTSTRWRPSCRGCSACCPAIPLEVRPVQDYREKEAAAPSTTRGRRTGPGRAWCTSIPATTSSAPRRG